MQYTSNYNLITVEGTDLVNPMTQMNPNFTSLDSIIKGVSDATITTATEVTVGTVHGLTRALPDANVIRFIATSKWTTGDTFEVDNTSVTALKTDGTTLKTGDYVIGSNVLGILDGTRFTVYVASAPVNDAASITYDNTVSGLTATDVQAAIDEEAASITTMSSSLNNLSSSFFTVTSPALIGGNNQFADARITASTILLGVTDANGNTLDLGTDYIQAVIFGSGIMTVAVSGSGAGRIARFLLANIS